MTHADLEHIIADLVDRLKEAPHGSAEARLVLRELEGLVSTREMAQPILEDHGIFMNHRAAGPTPAPGQILPLSRHRGRRPR
jgi:hypothetical protein